MNVLVVNAGSQSLKLRILDRDDAVVADANVAAGDEGALSRFVRSARPVDAVGHRVVHGGPDLVAALRIDDRVVAAIEDLVALAPLHQPGSVAGIRAVRASLPAVPAVACFDTAFHRTLPEANVTYALPAPWRARWPLHRFGFHGLSHARAVRRGADLAERRDGTDRSDLRVVSCHLGGGASLCAARGGVSVDTTMGFTPLEGLVMATRSGSVDPGLVTWLITVGGLSPDEVTEGLELRSGLLGLAGTPDMREVLAADGRGDPAAALALAVYVHRLAQGIAAMAASLGGVDVLVFTGGVGEHQPEIRARAAVALGFLGVAVDPVRNAAVTGDGSDDADVSAPDAPVRTVVVAAREDLEIARLTREVLGSA